MQRLLLLFFWIPALSFAQNTIGFPEVTNYSKFAYKGGLQNWDIKQGANGMMYIANNEGLLSFDGVFWTLYPLPNKTNVRSVETGTDQILYVGGQDELGYFAPSANGSLHYISLVPLLDPKHRNFGDVWDIVSFEQNIFFRTLTKIFQYNGRTFTVYPATSEWSFLGRCNNKLYAHDYEKGLYFFHQNLWQPVTATNNLPVNDPVTAILDAGNNSVIITTLKNGLFGLTGNSITAITPSGNELFKKQRIYAAVKINDQWFALATNNGGVYIINKQGGIIQQFSKTEGLQNNNVLSIFADKQQNLWLGLDNGIDLIAYNSAIKQIIPMNRDGSGYSCLVFKNHLYAGTSNGLFTVELEPASDLSFSKGNFKEVKGTSGQVWTLAQINNQLLMGHHEGAFVINNDEAYSISSQQGFWNFIPLSGVQPSELIAAGNYRGIRLFDYLNNRFIASVQIPGFEESSRFLVSDGDGGMWVSHPYHGIFRIQKDKKGNYLVAAYNKKKGLPSELNNHLFKIKNEITAATVAGVYVYNRDKDIFEPSDFFNKYLGKEPVRYLKEDTKGNVWFLQNKTPGVLMLENKSPGLLFISELSSKMLSGFEYLYPYDSSNIFMGGEKGFYHINFSNYRRQIPHLKAQISRIHIKSTSDSVLFGGYPVTADTGLNQKSESIPEIGSRWKTVSFFYAAPVYGYQSSLEYSYRLTGFEETWSEWSNQTVKEYTNLTAGDYRFEVKVRNNLGNESVAAVYEFIVLPPWYKTWWARVFYLFTAVSLIIYLYRRHLKKLEAQQQKFEEEQQKLKYIHELERSKTASELVALRNEKLEAEINFKNSEVASAAMHLVKKSELLTKMKGELTQLMKRVNNGQAESEIKKMIKSLSEDEHIDSEWENFTKHFDKVHSDFVTRLKEVHSNLTGNELKLCTYLRMNLSTKEIAQLMNISVRGVEISRYRLRKKLGIGSEVSLFDYLLTLKS
jgi:ligand-binding sensor domain-containing protein/DNA-binding CsgD family transcriptional regulator